MSGYGSERCPSIERYAPALPAAQRMLARADEVIEEVVYDRYRATALFSLQRM
jgi:hypothetical protein